MKTLNTLLLFIPLIAGLAQTNNQTTPAYFTVYNVTGDSTVPQQFVVEITSPAVIQQARALLTIPESERPHVRGVVVKAPSYFNSPWTFHIDPASVGFSDISVEVCDAATSEVEGHLAEVGNAFLPDSVWCPWSSRILAEIPAPDNAATSLRIASAASDSEAAISPGALVSIYGQNLTAQILQAGTADTVVNLSGVAVQVKAATETESRPLSLLMASPTQVNALIPSDMPPGPMSISLTNASGQQFQSLSYVEAIAPALFTISANNRDYAAATVQRVHADGTNSIESLVAVDPATGALVPVPLDFGLPGDEVYLSLYGTGFVNSTAAAISLALAGETTSILYAGPQSEVAGLDQVNVSISQSLSSQPFFDLQPSVKNPAGYPVKTNPVRILVHSSTQKVGTMASR
jgi:uncharacterized protein (TIGR03437 family)